MNEHTETSRKRSVEVIHQLQHAAQQYRIITANEDIIQRTGEQIVRACELQMTAAAWQQNFSLMVQHVRDWAKSREQTLALVLVDLRTDKTVFYVISRSEQYDFDLGLEQAQLDIFLNTRGGIGYVETRQVPVWEVERFVADHAYRVWPSDGD
jgi:hypothetical protein